MTTDSGEREPFDPSRFDRVDRSVDPAAFIRHLDQVRTRPNSQLVRAWSASKLELRSGRRVLDLGCGTGNDLIEVVSAVGREGLAVGIDVSATLLAVARDRTAAVPAVALVRADAEALPQRSGAYDACRVERVLLHVGDPSAVLAEIFRVLAPNGRVTIVEPDFAAWFADSPDPELDALVVAAINRQQHPNAGRTLARLLRVHGFIDVEITGHLAVYDGVPGGLELPRILDRLLADGSVDQPRVQRYLDALELGLHQGSLFSAVPTLWAFGRKPDATLS